MKFTGIENEIKKMLNEYETITERELLQTMPVCYHCNTAFEQAIVTALRINGVNMKTFFDTAFAEWEYILNKMCKNLPQYIQENLKD